MMESYANFYGVEGDAKVAKLSYNKLYQASREKGGANDPMQKVPQTMANDPAFKLSQKRFFQNEVSDTASQFNGAAAKFFDGGSGPKPTVDGTLGPRFQNVQESVVPANPNGEHYKGDTAKFFGEEAEIRSQGSVFNANKAAFFGTDKPQTGFKFQQNNGPKQDTAQVNTKSGLYKRDAAAFYGDSQFEVES